MNLFLAFLIIYGLNLSAWWLVPAVVIWAIEVQHSGVMQKQLRFVHWIAWSAARERGKV